MTIIRVPPNEISESYLSGYKRGTLPEFFESDNISDVISLLDLRGSSSYVDNRALVKLNFPVIRPLKGEDLILAQEDLQKSLFVDSSLARSSLMRRLSSGDELPYVMTVKTGFDCFDLPCSTSQPKLVSDFFNLNYLSEKKFDSALLLYGNICGTPSLRLHSIEVSMDLEAELGAEDIYSHHLRPAFSK